MNISASIRSIGTSTELKRIASAYVIDYRNLSDEEILVAIDKTAPQYFNENNIRIALKSLFFHPDRNFRVLSRLMLRQVILHKDNFICSKKETEDDIISYEQSVVNKSNEDLLQKYSARSKNVDLFTFVLETAWENDGSVSPDERNLIAKLQNKLRITDREYDTIEAKLGKYPKDNNQIHTRTEIDSVRRSLQSNGLLFAIRDSDNTDFDLIPDEIAQALRNVLGIEIRRHGYADLLNSRYVRSKKHLIETLQKNNIVIDGSPTVDSLKRCVLEQIQPSVLLGGLTPRDGLEINVLKKWCTELGLHVSGTKSEVISRIIEYYDAILQRNENLSDERELAYQHYVEIAERKLDFLRNQQLIQKDNECERKFEDATCYLFDKKLLHKPLTLLGTSRPDGALSFQDKIIYWDNKSKESPVNLREHIKQFDGYIKTSEKPVACFFVIGPEFTADSSLQAMQYQVENGTTICLVKAKDLKDIAESWSKKNKGKQDDPFPLGYLIQPGILNMQLVSAIL